MAGWIYLNLAEVQREWNNLAEAHRFLDTGLQLTQHLNTMNNTTALGHLILARVRQAEGYEASALQSIQRAKQTIERDSPVSQWVYAIQTRLWLAQGNVASATQWAQASGLPLDQRFDYALYPGEYSTLVRVYLAQERFEEAADLLDRMQTAAETAGRTGRLVEILMLQALHRQAQGDTEAAIPPLLQSLSLAEAGGYVRLYADEGAPMARLLRLIKARGSPPSKPYVETLLAACETLPPVAGRPGSRIASSESESLLVENLSERELEVLRLVADGLSNREIAEQLFITVGTAKTHTINIYRKLDVRSRTQAVARATELGLL
jgi:LuxR family maltose regulon positive regulatory protein